jgi:hypothetical protein
MVFVVNRVVQVISPLSQTVRYYVSVDAIRTFYDPPAGEYIATATKVI